MAILTALVGPSFVGKSSLAELLCAEFGWRRLAILTARPRRPSENNPSIASVPETEIHRAASKGTWIVGSHGGFKFGIDVSPLARGRSDDRWVAEVPAQVLASLKETLGSCVKTVLVWPNDFGTIQTRLATTQERSVEERTCRLALNEAMRDAIPDTDLRVNVRWVDDVATRNRHLLAVARTVVQGSGFLLPDGHRI